MPGIQGMKDLGAKIDLIDEAFVGMLTHISIPPRVFFKDVIIGEGKGCYPQRMLAATIDIEDAYTTLRSRSKIKHIFTS